MPSYGILMYPSYNRVYFQSSKDLAIAELEVANNRLSQPCLDIALKQIGGIDYIAFNTDRPLDAEDIKILSRLSFVYAVYEINDGDRMTLYPVLLDPEEHFEDDLVSILKYSGKTNEAFTKLMVNIGWLTSDSFNKDRVQLLDPICGKGTSLFQGLIYGFDVWGIELDRMAVQQATTFFTKYLKTKRYKHKVSQSKLSQDGKKICDITKYETADNKDDYKEGNTLKAAFYRGDTVSTASYIKRNSIDIIVGDLPYGVQHGSNTKTGSFTRNPEGLLREALPQWYKVLRPGGTLVLSWNTFILKKEMVANIMEAAGLTVLSGPPYDNFSHRVDQAIIRDIIVGKK